MLLVTVGENQKPQELDHLSGATCLLNLEPSDGYDGLIVFFKQNLRLSRD